MPAILRSHSSASVKSSSVQVKVNLQVQSIYGTSKLSSGTAVIQSFIGQSFVREGNSSIDLIQPWATLAPACKATSYCQHEICPSTRTAIECSATKTCPHLQMLISSKMKLSPSHFCCMEQVASSHTLYLCCVVTNRALDAAHELTSSRLMSVRLRPRQRCRLCMSYCL